MRHVSSRSGVATLRTAIHLLLTYLPRSACKHVRETELLDLGGVWRNELCVGLAIKTSRVRLPAGARLHNDTWQVVHTRVSSRRTVQFDMPANGNTMPHTGSYL